MDLIFIKMLCKDQLLVVLKIYMIITIMIAGITLQIVFSVKSRHPDYAP